MDKTASREKTAAVAKLPLVIIRRQFDPFLFKARKLRGHKPFSGLMAILGTIYGEVAGKKYIIASNEFSADFENLELLNGRINHQYTKSSEFEYDFRQLIKKQAGGSVEYFSMLRPFYELQIMEIFLRYPKYFQAFLSCNRGKKEDKWCLKCPKCAFLVLAVSAIKPDACKTIWNKTSAQLLGWPPLNEQITGMASDKVHLFDCIGTKEEIRLAINMLQETDRQIFNPYLMDDKDVNILRHKIFNNFNCNNFIPPKFNFTHAPRRNKEILF